jgi:hypothetical protein
MTATVVKFGNAKPKNVNHNFPCVSYVHVPEENDHDPDIDIEALRSHVANAYAYKNGVTNFPGAESLLEVVAPGSIWTELANEDPTWVASDDDNQLAAAFAAWYNCPLGEPDDVEETYYTNRGAPGVKMSPGPVDLLVNSGYDLVSKQTGGGGIYTATGTATATSATSLTNTGAAFSTSLVGQMVCTPTVYGVIESATATVLTIDRWYNYTTPGGAAGSTPAGTTTYVVTPGNAPALFMGVSTTNSASSATDTTMAGEITTAGGGLIRAIATYAHTASASTYTLANTFTANGTDSLPATVYRMGSFISMVSGWAGSMMLETLLNASATITTSGDAVTVTDTVTV